MKSNEIYFAGDFFIGKDSEIINFKNLFKFLGKAPLLINLEGTFVERDFRKDKFKACPLVLHDDILKVVPENVILSLANNHSTDFGLSGLKLTQEKLEDRIAIISSNEIFSIGGQRIIFMVDSREWCKPKDLDCFDFKLSVVNKMGNITDSIVYIHAGLEWRFYPSPLARRISHRLIDKGAKAVIFHHSHINAAIEIYDERYIFYGLGNFLFTSIHGHHGIQNNKGSVLKFNIEDGDFEIADVAYDNEAHFYEPMLNFKKVTELDAFDFPSNYKFFYKKEYPLDSSLRPRQLDRFEWMVDLKYLVWNFFVKILLSLGLTQKIKRIIHMLFG